MTITFTTPVIFGHSVFFETFNYSSAGRLLEWDSSAYDSEVGELWALGKFHIVVSKEK